MHKYFFKGRLFNAKIGNIQRAEVLNECPHLTGIHKLNGVIIYFQFIALCFSTGITVIALIGFSPTCLDYSSAKAN